jgi:hypothetical protein
MDKLKLFLLRFAVWVLFIHERTVTHGDGVVAPLIPVQKKSDTASFLFKEYYTVQIIIDLSKD